MMVNYQVVRMFSHTQNIMYLQLHTSVLMRSHTLKIMRTKFTLRPRAFCRLEHLVGDRKETLDSFCDFSLPFVVDIPQYR